MTIAMNPRSPSSTLLAHQSEPPATTIKSASLESLFGLAVENLRCTIAVVVLANATGALCTPKTLSATVKYPTSRDRFDFVNLFELVKKYLRNLSFLLSCKCRRQPAPNGGILGHSCQPHVQAITSAWEFRPREKPLLPGFEHDGS